MSPLVSTFAGAALRPYGFTAGAGGDAGAFELISTQLISSTTASVSFSSIVGTYKHLQLRIVGRQNSSYSAAQLYLRFNGDSGSNYTWHRISTGSGSVYSAAATGQTAIVAGLFDDSGSTTNTFGGAILDILDYSATTKNKTIRSLTGISSTAKDIQLKSGLWLNTAAITSMVLNGDGSWVAGTRISLYGVKGTA